MDLTFNSLKIIIQSNFGPVVCVLGLIAFILTNTSFPDRVNRCFIYICIALLLLTVSDSMRFYFGHLPYPTFCRYVAAGSGYVLRPALLFLLTIITSRYQKRKNLLFGIPLIICSVISIISIFPFGRGIMFSFSKDNVYIRGPFGYFSHYLTVFYSLQTIYYSVKNYSYNKTECLVLVIMEIAGCISAILVHFFGYDFILLQVIVSAILFYYFFLLTQIYKRDALTSFLNRRCFYLEINRLINYPMILLSMDLNNLKKYNDTKGHAAGDKAIVTVTIEMVKHFSKYASLYRTGGDEFMAVFKKTDIALIEKLVNKFQYSLSQTEYRVACGYAKYEPGDDIEKIINLCDKQMYTNKAKLKQEDGFKKI
ncbi:MAG: GGDEF domain-containing protein [Treponema sp.]|nr:GGDEF domain-containing protein [Treponema sp.]